MVITHVIHVWGQDPKHPKPQHFFIHNLGVFRSWCLIKGPAAPGPGARLYSNRDPCRRGPLTFWRPQLGEIPGCPDVLSFSFVYFSPNKIKQFSLQEVLVTRGCRTPIFLAVSMQTPLCLTSPCFAMKSGHVCKKTHKDSCHGRCVRRSHVASSCSFRKLTHSMRLRCLIDLGIETNMGVILVPTWSMHGILITASTKGNKWPATKCQAYSLVL